MTISDTDLGWLAGVIDGEGYIGLIIGGTCFRGSIVIANTNPIICCKVKRILDSLLVPYAVGFQRRKPKHKMAEKIVVYSHIGVERLLTAVLPLLSGKLEQAMLLHNWVIKKMEHKIERSTEWGIYEKMRELNKKGS